MSDRRVLILGAGPSGLSLAWRLAEQGVAVDVLEAESRVGGLAATVRQDGHAMDIGPHSFFSDDPAMVEVLQGLFDHELEPLRRHATFQFNGRRLDYPPTPWTILRQMGPAWSLRALSSHLVGSMLGRRGAAAGSPEESVEDLILRTFGRHLYRVFFKPYTEQFWGIPCSELAARTIPRSTRAGFMNALRSMLRGRSRRSEASLLDRESRPMYYPPAGYGDLSERMAARVEHAGGEVHLDCRVVGVASSSRGGWRVVAACGDRQRSWYGSHVVSTLPLSSLVEMLDPVAPSEVRRSAARLEYRPLVVLGLATKRRNVLGCGYVHLLDRPYNRVTDMSRFGGPARADAGNMILVEMPCRADGDTWRATREELLERCLGPLADDGILEARDVDHCLHVRARHAYPVYRLGFSAHLDRVRGHIEGQGGLHTLGRCGRFAYMDADECISRGFALADALLEGVPCR